MYTDIKTRTTMRNLERVTTFRFEISLVDHELPGLLNFLSHRRITTRERTFRGQACRAVAVVATPTESASIVRGLKSLGSKINASRVDQSLLHLLALDCTGESVAKPPGRPW